MRTVYAQHGHVSVGDRRYTKRYGLQIRVRGLCGWYWASPTDLLGTTNEKLLSPDELFVARTSQEIEAAICFGDSHATPKAFQGLTRLIR